MVGYLLTWALFPMWLKSGNLLAFDKPSARRVYQTYVSPSGWEKRLSVDGQVFYVNHVEKTTSWTPPVTTTGSSSGTPKRSKVLPVSEAVDDHEDEDHSRPEGREKTSE